MRKVMLIMLTCIGLTFVPLKSHAIIWVVVKAAAKKVIKAIDLQVQRLQNKTIGLQNAQKQLENTMSKLKLTEISDWVEKQRSQYEQYYSELWKVRNAISYYKRVKNIVSMQADMIDLYRQKFALFSQDNRFRPQQLQSMQQVYDGMLDRSLKNLEELSVVINSFATEMTDAERLAIISRVSDNIEEVYADMKAYNRSNALYSVSQARSQQEATGLRKMYGLD